MYTRESLLSVDYYQWKREQKEKENFSIASIHYKVNLLSNCLQRWRLNTTQSQVKKCRAELARIHYEDKLFLMVFKQWKKKTELSKDRRKCDDLSSLRQTFCQWKEYTSLARVLTQRRHHCARKYCNVSLLKNFFLVWKKQYLIRKANALREIHQKRRAVKQWKLRYLKNKLQCRLANAYNRKITHRHTFSTWKTALWMKGQKDMALARRCDSFIFNRYLTTWNGRSSAISQPKKRADEFNNTQRRRTFDDGRWMMKKYFRQWQQAHSCKKFSIHHHKWKERFLQKKHYDLWKGVIKEKHLRILSEEKWLAVQTRLSLKARFSTWKQRTLYEVAMKRKVKFLQCALTRKNLGAVLFQWRLVIQQELLIKPVAENRQRRLLQRQRSEVLRELRQTAIKEENEKLEKYFFNWTEFVCMRKAWRGIVVERYARRWLHLTQRNKVEKLHHQTKKAREVVLLKTYFCKWYHHLHQTISTRQKLEGQADVFYKMNLHCSMFYCWHRKHKVNTFVRLLTIKRNNSLLANAFIGWFQMTREDLNSQVENFNRHLRSSIDDAALSRFQQNQNHRPLRRHTMPSMPSFISLDGNFPRSTTPQQEREQNLETRSLNSDTKLTRQCEDENLTIDEKMFGRCLTPEQNIYLYESEDDTDGMEFSTLESAGNSILKFSESFTSANDSMDSITRSISSGFLSWTVHWKHRYCQSKEKARRRRSVWLEFNPPCCSTSRSFQRETSQLSCSSGNVFHSRFNKELDVSFAKQPSFLRRTLPFVQLSSNEDNTLMTSGISSFATEDNDDSVTSTNVTGTSTYKEHLLVATLRHWRHLDTSVTFYAWLKYTVRRKMLRHNRIVFEEKRREFLLHSMLLRWNRELYDKQVSHQFEWQRCASKSITMLREFVLLKKWKRKNVELACAFNRKEILRRCLVIWRSKFTNKERLDVKVIDWVDSTMANDSFVQLSRAHQNKWYLIRLRSFFQYWQVLRKKDEMASAHYKFTLLAKVLSAWWCSNLMLENRKKKLAQFVITHHARKYFKLWRYRHDFVQKAKDLCRAKDVKLVKLTFRCWLAWYRRNNRTSKRMVRFIDRRNRALLRDALEEWKFHHHQQTMAIQRYNQLLGSKVFTAWLNTFKKQKSMALKLIDYKNNNEKRRTLKLFCWWRTCAIASKIEKIKKQSNNIELLRRCFVSWRKSFLQQKCENHYSFKLITFAFNIWKKEYVLRRKQMYLMKHSSKQWLSFHSNSQTNQRNLSSLIDTKNDIALNETFTTWKENTTRSLKATQFRKRHATFRILIAWSIYSKRMVSMKKKLYHHRHVYEKHLLQTTFGKWRIVKNLLVERKIEEIMMHKAVVHHERRMKKRTLEMFVLCTELKRMEKRRSEKLARKYAEKWRNVVTVTRFAVTMYQQNMLNKSWTTWRRGYTQRHVARKIHQHDKRETMSKVFLGWLSYTRLKRTLPELYNTEMKKLWFRKWMAVYNNS